MIGSFVATTQQTDALGRWSFLWPWLAPLKSGDFQLIVVNNVKPPSVGFKVTLQPYRTPHQIDSMRQALALIIALGNIDREALVVALSCVLISLDSFLQDDIIKGVDPLFIKVSVPDSDHAYDRHQFVNMIKEFLTPSQLVTREFIQTVRSLCGDGSSQSALEMSVCIKIQAKDMNYIEPVLRELRHLRALFKGWCFPLISVPGDNGICWTLRVRKVEFSGFTRPMRISTAGISALEEFVTSSYGISIPDLQLSHLGRGPSFIVPADQPPFLERILCGNGYLEGELAKIEKFSYFTEACTYPFIERLFSALAESRTASIVNLIIDDEVYDSEKEDFVWECVAYAFFSKHAHTLTHHLEINGSVPSVASAQKVARVLSAENPSRHVFGTFERSRVSNNEGTHPRFHEGRYMLREGTKLLFKEVREIEDDYGSPLSSELQNGEERSNIDALEKVAWTLTTDIVGVRILQEGYDYDGLPIASVLVPGFGVCWLSPNDIVAVHAPETALKGQRGGVNSLEFNVYAFEGYPYKLDGLTRLLEAVNPSIMKLQLWFAEELRNFELDIKQLLESCPNVTSLSIKGPEVNARVLVEYCREHQRWFSELRCQFIDKFIVSDDEEDDFDVLAHELERDDSLLARNLKFLSIELMVDEERHMKVLADMLGKNRTLQYLEVSTCHSDYLEKYHDENLPVAKEIFPMPSRLAFLSVLRSRKDAPTKRLKYEVKADARVLENSLNPDVILKIFEFAAESVRRCIII